VKYFSNFVLNRDYYRIVATIAGAAVMVATYVYTQPVDLHRHNTLLAHLGHLQRDEARLGETVLQLNYNLSNNYDEVTSIVQHMYSIANELHQNKVVGDLSQSEEFRNQLHLFDQRLADKHEALEKFKSKNAVLKNSLAYLPQAQEEVLRHLPPHSAAHEYLEGLVLQVLFAHVHGPSLPGDHIVLDAALLEHSRASLPAEVRKQQDHLLHHIQLVDSYEQSLPKLMQHLVSTEGNNGLETAYRHYFERQQQRAAGFRLFLLLATLGLLGYAAASFLRLRESSRQLNLAASVFAHASDCFMITDSQGVILDVNPSFIRTTGYSREEVLGKSPRLLKSGRMDQDFYTQMWESIRETGQWEGEIWNRRKNDEVYPEWLSINAVRREDGTISHYIGSFVDITQRKQGEAEIHNLAFYDPLTQLPNRRLLIDRLHHALASNNRSHSHAALLFIDLDYFKTLNDTRGHDVGDLQLIEVAHRLQSCVREVDTVARLGGDEFVVMLEDLDADMDQAAAQAMLTGEKIQHALKQPYQLRDFEHHSSCSIGISLFDSGISVDDLLKRADTAMYQAKSAGRNTLRFFDPAMQATLEIRAALESDLHQALAQNQFLLYYQAQVNGNGNVTGAEALLRWNHPRRGLVAPNEFIPLAEQSDLIVSIGKWVMETACTQLKQWQASPLTRKLKLSVNVSPRQFRDKDFIRNVKVLIDQSGIDPSCLKLEITESMLLDKVDQVIDAMRQLKLLGVGFSMDDFGTGFSSLQYLKQLPLDELKIDQSFVRDVAVNANDKAIVRTIIAMAQSMGMEIIAEGVETDMQRQFLAFMGCLNYQGYLFSKPVPYDQFDELLAFKLSALVQAQ